MLEVAEALASAEKKLLFRVLVGGAVLDEETLAVLEQLEEVGSLRRGVGARGASLR